MKDLTVILFAIAIIVGLVIGAPIITIWSLNTLFPALAIEYGVQTWAAAFWLGGLVSGTLLSLKFKK